MTDKENKETPKRNLKIVFEDDDGKIKIQVISFGDFYNDKLSYKENLQDIAVGMAEDGGFWVNDSKIIPYHQVKSINIHEFNIHEFKNKTVKRPIRKRKHVNKSQDDTKKENK